MASKKQLKKLARVHADQQKNNLMLRTIVPLTDNQRQSFDLFFNHHKHLFLYGCAGTGKTFLALYFALKLLQMRPDLYDHVVIVRSDVATRKQGFLPGKLKEKNEVHELPYAFACNKLYGRGDSYQIAKSKGIVEFVSTSYLRGTEFDNAIVIVDECQNMTDHELNTAMTRLGNNCRIIFCGDIKQTDIRNSHEHSGFADFLLILQHLGSFGLVEFQTDDIVRSDIVKQYIITRNNLEQKQMIACL